MKSRRTLIWLAIFLVGFPLYWAVWLFSYAVWPSSSPDRQIVVIIPPRSTLPEITALLAEHQVIRRDFRFELLARIRDVSHRIRAGEYIFPPRQRPWDVLTRLAKGEIVLRPVTIPEGATTRMIADILAAGQWADKGELLALVRDPALISELGLEGDSLEGYLFPDTYQLTRGMDSRDCVRMMVKQALSVFDEEFGKGQPPLGLTRHQVLTLASIVEKETGRPEERPLVAAVLLNRLRVGMPLQTDPTVMYGLQLFDRPLTRKDLKTESPYNTYLIKGLPPGPIANPGRAAIAAVLAPAETGYLYFVSKNDGTHCFSETLADHNEAVRKYRRQNETEESLQ